MNTTDLMLNLPFEDITFAKEYANKHGLTIEELIDRYLRRLQEPDNDAIHPEVEKISGIIPEIIDGKKEFHEYHSAKHQ